MPSLWGLLPSEHVWEDDQARGSDDAYDPGQWEARLPAGMRDRINELWGTTVMARFPDVLVDQTHPEAGFARLLKPAATVWEGIFLTTWFLCFGPYSRTTLDGLADYQQRSLDELEDLGSPNRTRGL